MTYVPSAHEMVDEAEECRRSHDALNAYASGIDGAWLEAAERQLLYKAMQSLKARRAWLINEAARIYAGWKVAP